MKKDLTTWGLLVLSLIITCCTLTVGCSNLRTALFEASPPIAGVTNGPVLVQPRAALVDGVQTTGALFGPQGTAAAALVTSALGLLAALLNRSALRRHVGDGPAHVRAGVDPGPKPIPPPV